MAAPVNIDDLEAIAREQIPQGPFDYYAGGAEDEITLRENREAFRRTFLKYRVLVDVRRRDTRTSVLGVDLPFPVLLAPTALQAMAHPEGERAVAQAASSLGVIQTLSSVASTSIEDVAAVAPGSPRWFQLYVYTDRSKSETLVKRAEAAGYTAIAVTVDLPVLGRRERDMRNQFLLPPGIVAANLIDLVDDQTTLTDLLLHDEGLEWSDLQWLRSITSLPIVVKGVVRADDAIRAVEQGADAIWVSNHGGRQLDTSVATLDALREIAPAVGRRVPIVLDGGVRRGTDVLKALALGAAAVAVGRPQLWGLAAGGAEGVATMLGMLRDEFSLAMALAGCRSVDGIDPSLIA